MHEETLKKIVEENLEKTGKTLTDTVTAIQDRYEKEIKEMKETLNIVQNARDQYVKRCRELTEEKERLRQERANLIADKHMLLNTINCLEKEREKEKEKQVIREFQDYYTIRRFNEKYDTKMPSERACVLGKQATKLSKEARIEIKKVPDWQYGEVNSYREDVLLFVYAEEIKKSTNKLFGREKQILENYEKIKEQILSSGIVLPEPEGEAEKVGMVTAKFTLVSEIELKKIVRDFFEQDENYKISVETFHNYCQKYGLKVFLRDLVLSMNRLGFKASRRRYFGARKMCFIGLRAKL